MKNKGFTLIEFLVAVLIIGILAAIAYPQYQKALDKSRYTQVMILMEKMWQAEKIHKLANGNYITRLPDLDIELPTPVSMSAGYNSYYYKWGECGFVNGYLRCIVELNKKAEVWYFGYPGSSNRSCGRNPKMMRVPTRYAKR